MTELIGNSFKGLKLISKPITLRYEIQWTPEPGQNDTTTESCSEGYIFESTWQYELIGTNKLLITHC